MLESGKANSTVNLDVNSVGPHFLQALAILCSNPAFYCDGVDASRLQIIYPAETDLPFYFLLGMNTNRIPMPSEFRCEKQLLTLLTGRDKGALFIDDAYSVVPEDVSISNIYILARDVL